MSGTEGTLVGYARVSTSGQDLTTQEQALAAAGVRPEHLYVEKASGAKRDRPELEHAMRALRTGDALVVTKLDRVARSLKHLLDIIERVEAAGAGLRVLDQALDTTSPSGRLVIHVLGAVAEMERELIRERTKAALAARPEGKRGGRPPALTDKQVEDARRRVASGQPLAEVARILGVSRATLHRNGVTAAARRPS